jgi:cholesterol transport system auxiliary component
MRALRSSLPLLLALGLTGCFGGKTPPTLLTLTPLAGPAADPNRTASAGQSITIDLPVAAKEIRVLRVPVLEAPGTVTYIKGLQYLDTPDRLFRLLLTETVKRTTNRVVLDPSQAGLDPGLHVTGTLERFGFDTATGTVIVTYDAALSTAGGSQVQTRRFTASAPSDGTPASVGAALNVAANAVATDAARWIGG